MSEDIGLSDSIIRVMPETLANKIAAGEVVQRPASAAKELIENAIDAGADQITVILKDAGSSLIQVIDNGSGMSPTDAASCFQRHATSKITSIDDLEHIRTLGFRGEALASIAAVARLELRTKRLSDEVGSCVRIDGGERKSVTPCMTQNGTSVSVYNLFHNVPARRNFLKTPATELKHLVETFQFLALANPEIGFTLKHDNKEVYRLYNSTNGDFFQNLLNRIGDLLGDNHAQQVIPVEETISYVSLRGYISEPVLHRRSRGEQYLFINGRYIKNRSLDHAIVSGYEQLLPEGSYPFYTLFLDIDPSHIDVNVHPAKAEVQFDDERGMYAYVRTVVKKAISTAFFMPQINHETQDSSSDAPSAFAAFHIRSDPADPSRRDREDNGFLRQENRIPFQPGNSSTASRFRRQPSHRDLDSAYDTQRGKQSEQLYGAIPSGASHAYNESEPTDKSFEDDSLLWQIHDCYILTQIRSGLMVFDQNAVHERILYEKAFQSLSSGVSLSQQLLFPHTIDFSPDDFVLLEELLPDLRALGFDLEFFSGRSVVIRGVPTDIRLGDERTVLDDILEQYKSFRDKLHLKGRDNLAKSVARRSAIRAGTKLSKMEMRSLIDQLFLCEMPYACPVGRPTIIKIPIEELKHRFER